MFDRRVSWFKSIQRRPGFALRRPGDTGRTVALTLAGRIALAVVVGILVIRELDLGWQPIVVLAALAHTLMYLAPVALVLLVIARRWPESLVAGLALVLVIAVEAPLYRGAPITATGSELTLMQSNLRLGQASASAIVDAVNAHHVDILTAEEVTPDEHDRLVASGILRVLPYQFDEARPDSHGVVLFSRYPLSDEHDLTGFQLGVITATVDLPSQPITVVTAHVVAPFPQASAGWAHEISRLHADLDALPDTQPVVVGGDFNSTYDNSPFRGLLNNGFADAAERSGAGYLATYPADEWFPPLIGIDHVLLRSADALHIATIDLPGSDHRGLLARVRVDSPAQLRA